MKLSPIIISLTAIASLLTLGCVESELNCADLIKEFKDLPQELKFQGCEPGNYHQIRVLRAKYQVTGKDSLAIEKFLIDNYGMSPLKFVCCGWESTSNSQGRRYGAYTDRRGYDYELQMYSGEVLIPEQLRRQDVPYFYVEIIGLLEDP